MSDAGHVERGGVPREMVNVADDLDQIAARRAPLLVMRDVLPTSLDELKSGRQSPAGFPRHVVDGNRRHIEAASLGTLIFYMTYIVLC